MELPQDIIELHDEVSGRVKEYEQRTRKNPPIEVLNELRYALRGLVEFSGAQGKPEDSIQHIRHALKCAYHDLVDGLLIELSAQLEAAFEQWPEATIQVLGPRRLEILEIINRVEGKIARSRKNRGKRSEIYDEIYDEFSKLAEQLKFFDQVALPEIVIQADRLEAREKALEIREQKAQRIRNIGVCVGVIGIVISIIISLAN